jgi:hypothetical protein
MLTRIADYDEEVLGICEKNTRLNRHLFAHDDVARVRKLNWLTPPSFDSAEGSLSLLSSAHDAASQCLWTDTCPSPGLTSRGHTYGDEASSAYEWTQADVEDYRHVTVLLAADGMAHICMFGLLG